MRITMSDIMAELARAIGVLALVFLSFGHQPVALADASGLYLLPDGTVPFVCGQLPANADTKTRGASNRCAVHHIGAGMAPPEPVQFVFKPGTIAVDTAPPSQLPPGWRDLPVWATGPRAPPRA